MSRRRFGTTEERDEVARQALAILDAGEGLAEIAERFGCARRTSSKLASRARFLRRCEEGGR